MTDTGLTIDGSAANSFNAAMNIRQSIADAIRATVPEGKTGAAGVVLDVYGNAHAFLAAKLGEGWEISTDLTREGKHVSGKVMIAGSW